MSELPARGERRAVLDERQRQAVHAAPAPLLIVAGAGSGKTRVLTERAAALAGTLGPERVLVITFTNRAADELRTRLAGLLGEIAAARMTVGTFHAVCHRMLRAHACRAGRTRAFSIYDGHASLRLIAEALADEQADLSARLVASQLGQARARLLSPADYRALATTDAALAVARTWERYERALERCDALDFDQLLVRGVGLLAEPDLLATYRRRWRAVLIDEYQDTNRAQDEWVRRLAGAEGNLTVVADEDQAIYAFRGADVAGTLEFERHHPGASVVALERNYRSTGAIVAAAARLIAHNHRRRAKTMWTPARSGPAVTAIGCDDERDEAEQTAAWCAALIAQGAGAGEIAVLFRTRVQTRMLEDALLAAGIACRVQGGQGLWESAAVRDLLAHLTLLVNPRDRLALARALKTRPGVGPAAVARVLAAADAHDGDLLSACTTAAGLADQRAREVAAFGRTLRDLAVKLPHRGVGDTCTQTVLDCGLAERLQRERTHHADGQLQRLRRVCLAARRYEHDTDRPSLADFLAHAALTGGEAELPDAQLVTLCTLHAAKGAEWDHVRLVGVCEGLLPHDRALRAGELEEERRLAYVGITRARRELAISWPRQLRGQPAAVSRFIAEAGLMPAPAVVSRAGGRQAA